MAGGGGDSHASYPKGRALLVITVPIFRLSAKLEEYCAMHACMTAITAALLRNYIPEQCNTE
ncbi:MAG: hypothetical protein FRX49_05568 [Trebouxia sp. A1-2]|nr:MAG: hypothetical protein FRX49_05568 [Trebouxia sp. A1-2]